MSDQEIRSGASKQVNPTAITGTWTDLARHARYVYECMDHDTTDWMLAEAVLVLLGETSNLKKQLGYPGFAA